jgi:hypothetical protein
MFMTINWADPAVQSAFISTVGTVIASAVAAIAAALIGKRFTNIKELQKRLVLAQGDIAFLLAVEEAHCEKHKGVSGESYKNRMRSIARENHLVWSGKFTPSRAESSQTMQKARAACAES